MTDVEGFGYRIGFSAADPLGAHLVNSQYHHTPSAFALVVVPGVTWQFQGYAESEWAVPCVSASAVQR